MNNRLLAYLPLCTLILALFSAPIPSRAQAASSSDGHPDQIVLRFDQSALHTQAADGSYVSPPTEAPRAFTHMLVRRVAHVPAGATLTLALRASVDGTTWTNWSELNENDDLWMPADGPDVEWSDTVDAGQGRFWQVRATTTPAPSGDVPVLRQIDVNTVDTHHFTPQQAAAPAVQTSSASSAISKPAVISRVGWGSSDGEGSRVKPAYYPVNHMVVHHTADSNSLSSGEKDWSARVRAEWSFHTFTRGWGDVGYNYLIDPNGVIYEGRAGGDDAVAFHDTANYGSMGVVLIGTYANVAPTQAAQDQLVRLLSWKADQKDINPLGSSYYYGCSISSYCAPYHAGSVVLNIAGHREVLVGHTTCPGDQAVNLLPTIRNRVKAALTTATPPTDNGDLEIDELESSFARSPTNWYDAACGEGGHTYYSYTTDKQAESTNSATWRPNIPSTGLYRVYAHVPQKCGLGTSPYASAQASYRIHYANGDTTRTVDQNTADEWIDLGRYTFSAGNSGAVELYDVTGEPLSAKKTLFFDALKWVPESSTTNVQVSDVQYDKTEIASGNLLRVTFTVKNTGGEVLRGQAPQTIQSADASSATNSYVYDQSECFNSDTKGSSPAFPKESSRFRVLLGPSDSSGVSCAGDFGGYPWRWGLNGDLQPGATQQVIGYVRFKTPGTYTLRAAIIQEYVDYFAQNVKPTTITVTPEQTNPESATYDAKLLPLARVYKLGSLPDNFLARTFSALSVPRGEYVGSFVWDGSFTNWNDSGPLGLTDHYLIEQTRSFVAPIKGVYTFRTTTDDGSWLWVDGQAVVNNAGVHGSTEVTGTMTLEAGVHTLEFKYFDRDGLASAGYGIKMPGTPRITDVEPDPGSDPTLASVGFVPVADALSSAQRIGATFTEQPALDIAAGDADGSGVRRVRWSLNNGDWQEASGALLHLGSERFPNGGYTLRYYAVDGAGNIGEQRSLAFAVNTDIHISKLYLPLAGR